MLCLVMSYTNHSPPLAMQCYPTQQSYPIQQQAELQQLLRPNATSPHPPRSHWRDLLNLHRQNCQYVHGRCKNRVRLPGCSRVAEQIAANPVGARPIRQSADADQQRVEDPGLARKSDGIYIGSLLDDLKPYEVFTRRQALYS